MDAAAAADSVNWAAWAAEGPAWEEWEPAREADSGADFDWPGAEVWLTEEAVAAWGARPAEDLAR